MWPQVEDLWPVLSCCYFFFSKFENSLFLSWNPPKIISLTRHKTPSSHQTSLPIHFKQWEHEKQLRISLLFFLKIFSSCLFGKCAQFVKLNLISLCECGQMESSPLIDFVVLKKTKSDLPKWVNSATCWETLMWSSIKKNMKYCTCLLHEIYVQTFHSVITVSVVIMFPSSPVS